MRRPGFPQLLGAYAVIIAMILVMFLLRPDPSTERGRDIYIFLLMGGIMALFLWLSSRQWPKCDLHFGPEREQYYDSEHGATDIRYVDKPCDKKAVGSVRINFSSDRGRRKFYFCAGHDPEQKWMRKWLYEKEFHPDMDSVRRFGPSEEDNEDRSPPDFPL